MAKYIIEMDEPRDCQSCSMWSYDYWGDGCFCSLSENISSSSDFFYYQEIHKDCPLVKVEE